MKANALKKKIADGVNCVGGWAAIPNPFAAEVYAAAGLGQRHHRYAARRERYQRCRADPAGHPERRRRHAAGARALERSRPHHARARTRAPWASSAR